MHGKGLLQRSERYRSHVYEPCRSRAQTQRQLAHALLERAFAGSASALLQSAWGTQDDSPGVGRNPPPTDALEGSARERLAPSAGGALMLALGWTLLLVGLADGRGRPTGLERHACPAPLFACLRTGLPWRTRGRPARTAATFLWLERASADARAPSHSGAPVSRGARLKAPPVASVVLDSSGELTDGATLGNLLPARLMALPVQSGSPSQGFSASARSEECLSFGACAGGPHPPLDHASRDSRRPGSTHGRAAYNCPPRVLRH